LWIIVIIVIGSLVLLGVLLLAIPFDLYMEFDVHGKSRFSVNWSWFFGLIKKEIKFKRSTAPHKKPSPQKSTFKTIQRGRELLSIIRTPGIIGHTLRFIQRIIRQFRIRELESEWYIGLDSPDETFYLFTLTEPLNRILNYYWPYALSIRPSFIESCLEGYLRGNLRLYPILLLPPMAQFIFSIPAFRVLKQVIGNRWKKRRFQSEMSST
jgi:hypothetical protein